MVTKMDYVIKLCPRREEMRSRGVGRCSAGET